MTKEQLLTAATLKLEITSTHYSDIFTLTAKAFGGKIKKPSSKAAKTLPKASFDQMASFMGAM